jgi:hypothetical protein
LNWFGCILYRKSYISPYGAKILGGPAVHSGAIDTEIAAQELQLQGLRPQLAADPTLGPQIALLQSHRHHPEHTY